jgi:hypothetical protein
MEKTMQLNAALLLRLSSAQNHAVDHIEPLTWSDRFYQTV